MATLLDSYGTTNYDTYNSIVLCSNEELDFGSEWTTPNDGNSYTLDSCQFYLLQHNSISSGTLQAFLYADGGVFGTSGLPTGSILASSTNTISASTISSSITLYTFTFDNTYTLAKNTHYCIDLHISSPGAGYPNYIGCGLDDSSPTSPNCAFYTLYTAPTTWVTVGPPASGGAAIFYVYGTKVVSANGNFLAFI